jgi:hypothetical protein
MSESNPVVVTLGLCIVVGFVGSVIFGMAWALCAGVGLPQEWPRGLTMMFAVPFLVGFTVNGLVDHDKLK